MKTAICRECGYFIDNKESGFYFCPQCQKKVKFIEFEAFCGAKPGELHEKN